MRAIQKRLKRGVKIFLGFIVALGILALAASSANAAPIEPGQVECWTATRFALRVRPSDLSDSMRQKLTGRNVRPSAKLRVPGSSRILATETIRV
jgi:hypothetical protein